MADSARSHFCRFSIPPSPMRHMLLLSIVLALCSICSCTAAFAQEAPYKATWPAGWSVTELPGPRPYSEKDLGGKRIRVTKTDDGVVLRQWTAMALGADSLYSLSFSGLEAKFEKYKLDFERCKQSLTLK